MGHLENLPVEIISLIVRFIANEDIRKTDGGEDDPECYYDDGPHGYHTLIDLCLTSESLRKIAQPMLFEHLEDDDPYGVLRKVGFFARTIWDRPDLAKHVQAIEVVPGEWGVADALIAPGRRPALDAPTVKRYEADIKSLKLADKDLWIESLRQRDISTLTALVANRTPNVRKISIPRQLKMDRFNRIFDRNPSFLSELEIFFAESDNTGDCLDVNLCDRILTRPNLKHVLFDVGTFCNASSKSKLPPGSVAAEQVFFRHCHIDSDSIQTLMKACKNLVHFTRANFWPDKIRRVPTDGLPNEFTAPELLKAILLHKDTLETFRVDFFHDASDLENLEEYVSSCSKFGSFRDFSVLKTILVPQAYLNDHPEFPSSMEHLTINDCSFSIHKMTENIAKDYHKGLYPHLTSIRVVAMDTALPVVFAGSKLPADNTDDDHITELQEYFKGTSVDYQVSPYEFDFDEPGGFSIQDVLAHFANVGDNNDGENDEDNGSD
ncbi:hypothetical protein N7456_002610 [Penicillium angulare]|uniref:Uncharacterized protein n=1 Tax=Penicillium angulare TaxID=116970 RepID=A0A9W9KQF1_9EURO|nr:hypothetical protein N7456_002610 [Penicillium angulare]